MLQDNSLLKFHLEIAARPLDKFEIKGSKINFRCNVCGDGVKNTRKKSAWIYESSNKLFFHCFNCGTTHEGSFWLKKYFPSQYNSYLTDLLEGKSRKSDFVLTSNVKETTNLEKLKLVPLSSNRALKILLDAKELCKKRKIPEDVWKKFYVCLAADEYNDRCYVNRLVIPFYDNRDRIYYFQARSMYGEEPKYIGMRGDKNIYNLHNIDRDKPIIATEGMLDSLFVENSIALVGAFLSENNAKQLDGMDVYYLLDDDDTGRKVSKKLIDKGCRVFLWEKFKNDQKLPPRDKWDINEYIIYKNLDDKLKYDDLKKYFSNNYVDKVYLV